MQQSAKPAPHMRSGTDSSATDKRCPSQQDSESALEQASIFLQQAQYSEASKTLQPLARLHCEPRASLLLAAALEGSGDLSNAEKTLEQAHSVWPSNDSIAASLAREYMSTGQVDKAASALDHFHATAATPPQEMEEAVIAWLASHQLASARSVAQIAYNAHPSLRSLLLLANSLQLEGRYKDVIALLQGKRAGYAQAPAFLVTIAESEYDANIFDAARQDLEHAIELDHTMYQAHYLLGNVLMKQGDVDAAGAEYRVAIELAPEQARTHYQLALVLRAKQDAAGEESELAMTLAIDDHYALAHAEMGRILLNQNRLPEAVAQLNLAIEDNPNLEQPYNLLARAYNRLGDIDKASAAARRLAAVRAANHKGSDGRTKGQMQTEDSTQP
jgi:Flp pilus assembly protein TadD